MASNIVDIPGIGQVSMTRRAQSRSIRLRVTPAGVFISLPSWTPYKAGIHFALQQASWIQAEQAKQIRPLIEAGQRVGKLHYVRFEQVLNGQPANARVSGTEIIVRMAPTEHSSDKPVQERAAKAAVRALKREAEQLLPARLQNHARIHDFTYSGVSVKSLKRRWGSCDSHQAITLNLYLMELPWDYIDYVLLHELTHTVHMDHSPAFWQALVAVCPRGKDLSRQLRRHQPLLGNWQP